MVQVQDLYLQYFDVWRSWEVVSKSLKLYVVIDAAPILNSSQRSNA